MKKLLLSLLMSLSITGTLACTPGAGNGPNGDPNCMGGVLSTDPYYNGSQQNISAPKKVIRHITVNVPSKYGALALNKKTGISGGSLNATSKSEAIKEAIRTCENGGRNAPCKIVTWVRNGCIAASTGKFGKAWKTFYAAEERGEAEKVAMAQCKSAKGANCKISVPEGCSIP